MLYRRVEENHDFKFKQFDTSNGSRDFMICSDYNWELS